MRLPQKPRSPTKRLLAKSLMVLLGLGILAARPSASHADELTLFNYVSPGLDWSTPQRLGKTMLEGYSAYVRELKGVRVHPIGHVAVELKCDTSAFGPAIHFSTAMEPSSNTEAARVLLVDQAGLGVLFFDLKGELDDTAYVQKTNAKHVKMGKGMNFVTFKIRPSSCQRLVQYYSEYIARGYGAHYGLQNRPRYGEGAGCSAFGISFIDIAGFLTDEWKTAWSRTIVAPAALTGGQLNPGNKVPFSSILKDIDSTRRWAYDWEPHYSIFFYDPDLIYAWVNDVYERESHQALGEAELTSMGPLRGLIIDRTSVETPTDPIWITN